MSAPEIPRFGELLRRIFGTRAYDQANVLEDYFPSLDLLSEKAELRKLRDERSFVVGGKGIGAAGVSGRVWVMNKIPGQLAIIERISYGIALGAGGTMLIDMTTIGLPVDGAGGQSSGMSQDSRYGTGVPGTTPVSPVTVANDTTGAPSGVQQLQSANLYPVHFVLRPNYALTVTSSSAGVGNDMVVSFWGYTRAVEDNELK